jgi:drug/metabolite transporter (DMT)-like permease
MGLRDSATPQLWAHIALLAVVAGNILGNLFMKIGSGPDVAGYKLLGIFGWPTLVGLGIYGSCVLLYAWSLRYVDLHFAQAVVSLQFAGAVLLAGFFFGEVISLQKWIGLGLIFTGLVVCLR